jgi:hypothetical protein
LEEGRAPSLPAAAFAGDRHLRSVGSCGRRDACAVREAGDSPEVDMGLLDEGSLGNTVDALNEALFFGRPIPKAEARRAARWIAVRRGLAGSYAGMFAPTPKDYADGIRLFTGERISSGAATGHILGEEACRALLLLDVGLNDVRAALARATRSMEKRLRESEAARPRPGFF